jgi:hypothetical protein
MAIRGRRPAGQGVSNNRHAPVHRWTDVEAMPFNEAPELPRCRVNGRPWTAALRGRWAAWSSMPHCRLWGPSDWEFAFDTMEIAARFYETSSTSWSTELRYREKIMGTTLDARQGLRIRYIEPTDSPPATVSQLDDFRDL